MVKERIDGAALRDMFLMGAAELEKNKAYVDSLNVFPVPDGDTGSNMSMTMQGAARMVQALPETASTESVFTAASQGALRNARGNSGVILSQIFRGFISCSKGKECLSSVDIASAFSESAKSAYKAVMKPKEGTILTVIRCIGEKAVKTVEKEPEIGCTDLFRIIIAEGEAALKSTPELLPVLKEAGVVDSGGKGLMLILSGFYMALMGENAVSAYVQSQSEELPQAEQQDADLSTLELEDIEFGYCTEFFIIHLNDALDDKELDNFRKHLLKAGDSIVLVRDEDTVKVHVHTNCPGKILQMALKYGELYRLKIENMREQNRQLRESRKKNRAKAAMIAVSTGAGIDKIFGELAVSQIIPGGQTMNPSIDTIVNAVRRANADTVFVLPNNSNIILAATQAVDLCDSKVVVIPTKSVPQGFYAAMAFNPEATPEENEQAMQAASEGVTSGSVTYAVRETVFKGRKISEGDIIGIMNGDICAVAGDIEEAAEQLLKSMIEKVDDEEATVNLYYGSDLPLEKAEALLDSLQQMYPDAEISLHEGGQPLYFLYFSVV